VQSLFHVEELFYFALYQPRYRDARPLGDDFGNVLLGNLGPQHGFFFPTPRGSFLKFSKPVLQFTNLAIA